MLEESFYAHKTAEYVWLVLLISSMLLTISSCFSSAPLFLGPYLSNALVYLWARRNPDVQLSFLGLFVFSAPYLPWVMMVYSAVMKSSSPKSEILGIVVGHLIFFFEDIYPSLTKSGVRIVGPPWLWFEKKEASSQSSSAPVQQADNAAHPHQD